METRIVSSSEASIAEAAELLRRGEVVAFPTETVYGLGANALDPVAVGRIFVAKERPADNPLIVHIADIDSLHTITKNVPAAARRLMERFWPGPLSLVLEKSDAVPLATTAGLESVVVRYPSHPVAARLIRSASFPLAAPSANRSGNVSPTLAEHVAADLDGRIPLVLDDGPIEFGLESTVVDCTSLPFAILRPGSITLEMLREIVPDIIASEDGPTRSPGMKYRHYSPQAPLTLFIGSARATETAMHAAKEEHDLVIAHSFDCDLPLPPDAEAAAPLVYRTLRAADERRPRRILVQGYPGTGVGAAIMNRLRKAAESIVEVDQPA